MSKAVFRVTEDEFDRYRREGYALIPVIKKITNLNFSHFMAYASHRVRDPRFSMLQSGRSGRYSYIGDHLLATVSAKGSRVVVEKDGVRSEHLSEDPLHQLKKVMARWRAPFIQAAPDWKGGAIGYFAYDMVRRFETLPCRAADDLGMADYDVSIYRDVMAYDHENDALYLISNGRADRGESYADVCLRIERWQREVRSLPAHSFIPAGKPSDLPLAPRVETSFSKEAFMAAATRVQEYIRAGDVFQVNLSVRQAKPLYTQPWDVYLHLLSFNPSPYMAYVQTPEYQLVSGSPELLVKLKNRRVHTRPIAGTRPRGRDRAEDLRLAEELIANEKERAEHIMLVDLERNDLGRVCKYGTVKVDELMVIEEYSHVMHIVSHVTGELADAYDAYDLIRACFPGGTITGAPKVRTMEIIEELEPVTRGVYTGSIGWIGFDGDMELNIVIRTLISKRGKAYVQAGAGIVIDSDPEAEFYESLKKAEALWRAVELSESNQQLSRESGAE